MQRRWTASTFVFICLAVAALPAQTVTPAQPATPAATLTEARTLIDAGKPAAAIEKLRSSDAGDPRIAELLGVAYYHAGDTARAIATRWIT